MKKYKIIALSLLALSVVSYLFLPETVITQLSAGGTDVTTMPKILGVLIPRRSVSAVLLLLF